MHANSITTPTTPATTTTCAHAMQPEPSPAGKLERAQALIRNAFMLADDECVPVLTWAERDALCRQLSEAMRLMREAAAEDVRAN